MGYNHEYEASKRKWTRGRHFINHVVCVAAIPVIIAILPIAAIWNSLRRRKNTKI